MRAAFKSVIGAVLALSVGLGFSACSSSRETSSATPEAQGKPVTIGLTYIPNIQFSPFYVAQQQKLFGEQPVKLRHHGQNEGLFTALIQGNEDVVIAGADEAAQAHVEGHDLVVVAPYYNTYPVVILVPEASPIKSVADLKGKTIGLPGKYGENWFGLQYALNAAGLSESDVTIQAIGYTQRVALQTGSVDAVVGFSNNDAVQFKQAGFAAREIALGTDPMPLMGASIITTKDFAKAHSQELASVISGIQQGISKVVTDPEVALDATAQYVPDLAVAEHREAAAATLQATIRLFPQTEAEHALDPARLTKMVEALGELGITTKTLTAEDITVPVP
ncbi:ABC transporter substrate-binding protein [Boudabousia marimammalium]|uniref:Solute-binding protein family 3/N-terminal domain-containing protein n=1 Tax=Boudabousia marimammalium TaxID=156892 RepID=A0A1Q5PR31_9ACTO|nr:ABC transporter substrate-binding protein [Boudabousia marimammalium]OKL49996.1 hypothetical protein BM477_03630 [Boudabousia marimammalium]